MKRIYRLAGCVCLVSLALLSVSALNLRADEDKREEEKDRPQAAAAQSEKHFGIRVQMEKDGRVRGIVVSREDEDGDGQAAIFGKVIIVGPDGKMREIDLTPGKGVARPFQLQAMTGYMIGLQCIPPGEDPSEEGQAGMVIASVFSGSPAEKAGIQKGDVLIKVGNRKVDKVEDLIQAVQNAGKGKKALKLTLLRGDEEKTVEVKPVERKAIKMQPGMRVLRQLDVKHPELKDHHKRLFELKEGGSFSIDLEPGTITLGAPAKGNAEVEKLKNQVEKLTRQVKQLQKAVQELKNESEDE